jgi:hypothetical protein
MTSALPSSDFLLGCVVEGPFELITWTS